MVKERETNLRVTRTNVSTTLAFAELLREALGAYAAEHGIDPAQCVPPKLRDVANEIVGVEEGGARKRMRLPIRNYKLRGGAL